MKNLLAIVPPYEVWGPPAGISALLGYLKYKGCDDFGFIDMRLFSMNLISPTFNPVGAFGESFVIDIPDLPLVLMILEQFDKGGPLYDFDKEMIQFINKHKLLTIPSVDLVWENKPDKVMAFHRGLFLFVFNFNPTSSYTDYGIPLGAGKYKIVLNTDSGRFGGNDLVDEEISYYTMPSAGISSQHYLKLYLPARTALVLKKIDFPKIK